MRARKYQEAARSAGESFSVAASVAGMIFDIVGSFFKIPEAWKFLKWVGSAIVGLVSACISARNACKKVDEEESELSEASKSDPGLNSSASVVFSTLRNASANMSHGKPANDKDHTVTITLDDIFKSKGSNDRFFADENASTLTHRLRSEDIVPGLHIKRMKR